MGDGHPRAAAVITWGKWGRHDDSDHGTVQGKRRWAGTAGQEGLSRGLERSSRSRGFEPWLWVRAVAWRLGLAGLWVPFG
ncbi:hypothetical protein CRG98_017980 [Punica granatum]|uniref:Uncharacterized protein n=1 Tax=Punica granatum TaxID=22663 RepID=A0A2I0JZ60_PUNGR|nr:hypothetical protein CRG98_017980 [Punica granatum]